MYALVYSPDELLSSNCSVTLFDSYELAYKKMVELFNKTYMELLELFYGNAVSNDWKPLPPDELGDVRDKDGYYIGVILDSEAWHEYTHSKWAIVRMEE